MNCRLLAKCQRIGRESEINVAERQVSALEFECLLVGLRGVYRVLRWIRFHDVFSQRHLAFTL